MIPTPDGIWSAVYNINSYDEYLERIPHRSFLKSEVCEDVRGIFKLVQRMIDLAYYEYQLIDIASMKALFAYELALKKRYEEVKQPSSPNHKNLKSYIDWFRENGYFETDSTDFLDQIRHIRNSFAHPQSHSIGGPMVAWHIYAAASLVNDIYEDVDLRIARKQEAESINNSISEIIEGGALFADKAGLESLVYLFETGFINNKNMDKQYHFIYKPIFEIPMQYEKGDPISIYPAIDLVCHSVRFSKNKLLGMDKDGMELFRLCAPSAELKIQLAAWYQEYKSYVQFLPHFPFVDTREISDKISSLLLNFYKS